MDTSRPGDGGLFIFLPDKITKKIYSWQARFSEYVRMPKPHLTLMYPPYISKEMWKGHRKKAVDAVRSFRPFRVKFTKTGFFSDPYFLYIAPHKTAELNEMNKKLSSICPENIQGLNLEEFIPHVSIGTFPSKDSAVKARSQLEVFLKDGDLEFVVKEIFFTALDDDLRWKIYDIISLAEDKC
ncbi:MAG: 2'-5' RNA ligase family protein [Candidatus Delongbacteria bacterium]